MSGPVGDPAGTAGGFAVDTGVLTAHASAVRTLAVALRATSEAARPLGTGAYGLVGQVFAGDAITAAARADAAVTALAGVLDTVPDDLHVSVEEYRRADDEAADRLRGAW